MCILATKPIGHEMTERNINLLKIGVLKNPHGYGYYSYNTSTGEEEVYHSFDALDFVNRVIERGKKEYSLVYHARIKTSGDMTMDNLHPFKSAGGWQVFQNGTTNGLTFDKEKSDTSILALMSRSFLKGTKQSVDGFCAFFESIENSRLVFARKKEIVYANEQDGVWDEGIWYSNDRIFKTPIFVYGTLKQGHSNERVYLGNDYFPAYTRYKYPLVAESLPMMFNQKGLGNHVNGEIILASDHNLKSIDNLEGHPDWYKREIISINIKKEGFSVDAYAYFMQGEIPEGSSFSSEFKQKPSTTKYLPGRQQSMYPTSWSSQRGQHTRNRLRNSMGNDFEYHNTPHFYDEIYDECQDPWDCGVNDFPYRNDFNNENKSQEDDYYLIVTDENGEDHEMDRTALFENALEDIDISFQDNKLTVEETTVAYEWLSDKYESLSLIEFAKVCGYPVAQVISLTK